MTKVATHSLLVTGGSGLLGTEIQSLVPQALYPASSDFDITNINQINQYLDQYTVNTVLHAAAFTSPPQIEKNPMKAIQANIIGTSNIVIACASRGIKLIYISTDYVFDGKRGQYKESDPVSPINKYAWSKLGGESAVRLYDNAIIVRTTFGEVPFPYEKGLIDQWTSRESVEVVARMILPLLDIDYTGTIHVAGNRKTVYEYAKKISPEKSIGKLSIHDLPFTVPQDTSLDCSCYQRVVSKHKERVKI